MSNEAAVDLHQMFRPITGMQEQIHFLNVQAGWYSNLNYTAQIQKLLDAGLDAKQITVVEEVTGLSARKITNIAEKLMLIVSECSEAMEGARKNLMDDKLPHRKMLEVELADALIRIFDTAGDLKLDLAGAVAEKILYNQQRKDHKIENRLLDNGKKF
jgi:NTP pyrophosphatase (non-canonical NTP hydrolase)